MAHASANAGVSAILAGWLRSQLQGDAPLIDAPVEASTNAVSEAIRAFRMLAQARDRLAMLYRTDKVLYGRFEAAMQQQDLVGEEPMAGSQ